MFCSHQLRALGKLSAIHFLASLKQIEANSQWRSTKRHFKMSSNVWNQLSNKLSTHIVSSHQHVTLINRNLNVFIASTKPNETLKLQTKLLLSIKSSQPQQDSASLNLFFSRGICIMVNFTLPSSLLLCYKQMYCIQIKTYFIHTVSHSIPFLFVQEFACHRLFFLQLWNKPRQWDPWSKCYISFNPSQCFW